MTSILTVTFDRKKLAEQCLGHALSQAGSEYEFLSVDNGSTDGVQDYVASLNPVFHQLNSRNEGYASMLNQMLLRARGDFFCILDPDLIMPKDWLSILVLLNKAIPQSGLSSYHCVLNNYAETHINGYGVHPGPEVFGVKFFNRKILETVGFFNELGLYGLEDNAYNYRLHQLGYLNYYVGGGMSCQHVGEDSGDQGPYRQMKWRELEKAKAVWIKKKAEYDQKAEEINEVKRDVYYVPPPRLRWVKEPMEIKSGDRSWWSRFCRI